MRLFEVVGKDEFSLRNIETLLRPLQSAAQDTDPNCWCAERHAGSQGRGRVLVVGVDSFMTQLAKCCKPAPPDPIPGFVTRGKGVSVHRTDCSNFRQMAACNHERVIDVAWGASNPSADSKASCLPVDVAVQSQRPPRPVARYL